MKFKIVLQHTLLCLGFTKKIAVLHFILLKMHNFEVELVSYINISNSLSIRISIVTGQILQRFPTLEIVHAARSVR